MTQHPADMVCSRTWRNTAPVLLLVLLLGLPSCVLAVGNSGGNIAGLPKSTAPLLRQKVEAAEQIVDARRRILDDARARQAAGRADAIEVAEAEIAHQEARMRALQLEAELQAVRDRDDD